MYSLWQQDNKSVHPSWHAYFSSENFEAPPGLGKSPLQNTLDEIVKILKSGGGAQAGG
jgi:hypothetical protein